MDFCGGNGGHISGNEIVKPFGTKGALLYGVIPVCALGETERLGPLNVWGAPLRSAEGTASLAPLCGYPCMKKT